MKKIIAFLALILSNTVWAEPQTVMLSVPSMYCAMCPITVRKALENVNGVNDVEVSYASKQAVIQYDDEKANIKALIEATTQAGYPSQLVER